MEPLYLKRNLTCHKTEYATSVIKSMNLKSTTVLIEYGRYGNDNNWLAHYYDVDENGNLSLEQKYVTGDENEEISSQFGVDLTRLKYNY